MRGSIRRGIISLLIFAIVAGIFGVAGYLIYDK